jgi:type VI secretion system secreted protein VgrG
MRHAPLLLALLAFAPTSTAAEPLARLTSDASAPLAISRLTGEEAISSLYRYEVELSAPPASFESLLGHAVDVSVAVPGGQTRHFAGIVSRVSQGAVARAEIVPRLWLLTRRSRSRMFQGMSVPEIVDRVLDEGQIPHSARLAGDFSPRDCVVQYNESDFAFISRLMEDEGIFYFFAHDANGESMVLGDTPAAHSDLPGGATIRWLGDKPGRGVHEWTKTQELRSGKSTLRDFAFHFPDDSFEVSAPLQESVAAGNVIHQLRAEGSANLELYEYPGEYAQRFDGDDTPPTREALAEEAARTVAIRAGEEGAQALHVEGASDLPQLTSGHRFALSGDARFDGVYIVRGVTHEFEDRPGRGGASYENSFTCVPVGLPFRPERKTPRPRAGIQSAIVTGPPGAEVHTDKLGRVKVRFFWDREGTSDEHSSCWIRVSALHAGQEDGFAVVPEVGDEVVVGFEHGDPDRPVVLGSVYNPKKPAPGPRR